MIEQFCQICYESHELAKLECNCTICSECLQKYTKIQIEEFWTSDGTHMNMVCPGQCGKKLYFEQIEELAIQNKFIVEIHNQLFKSYCKKSQDIYQCPNNSCEFYYLKPCKRRCQDICQICQTKLECKDQITFTTILNNITEFYTTRQCPRCEILITKNGGCSHMTCQICKYEFCWDCKQNCKDHDWSVCIQHNIFILIIVIQLFYTLLISIGLHSYLLVILAFLFPLIYMFILNNSLLLLFGLILVQLKKLNDQYQKITLHRIIFASLTILTLILIEYFIIEYSFMDWITYLFKEFILLIIILIFTTIFNSFYKAKIKSE